MMYALNLSTKNRILSACVVLPATPADLPRVDALPEGDINDYLFVNGEYVYAPLPVPDTALIADTNIPSGKYFMAGGEMFLAITNIPAGDTITPGTNCAKTSMSEALNALNS